MTPQPGIRGLLEYLASMVEDATPAGMMLRATKTRKPQLQDVASAAIGSAPPRRPASGSPLDLLDFALAQPGMLPIGEIGPVFHGTGENFSGTFDPSRLGQATHGLSSRMGTFFTPDKMEAERYVRDFHRGKGQVIPAMLRDKKPYYISFKDWDALHGDWGDWKTTGLGMNQLMERAKQNMAKFRDDLLARGHDAVVVGEPGKMRPQEVIALTPDIIEHQIPIPFAKRGPVPVLGGR